MTSPELVSVKDIRRGRDGVFLPQSQAPSAKTWLDTDRYQVLPADSGAEQTKKIGILRAVPRIE